MKIVEDKHIHCSPLAMSRMLAHLTHMDQGKWFEAFKRMSLKDQTHPHLVAKLIPHLEHGELYRSGMHDNAWWVSGFMHEVLAVHALLRTAHHLVKAEDSFNNSVHWANPTILDRRVMRGAWVTADDGTVQLLGCFAEGAKFPAT